MTHAAWPIRRERSLSAIARAARFGLLPDRRQRAGLLVVPRARHARRLCRSDRRPARLGLFLRHAGGGACARRRSSRRVGHIRAFAAFVAIAVGRDRHPARAGRARRPGSPRARCSASSSPASMRSSNPGSTPRPPTPTAARSTAIYQIVNFVASACGQLLMRGLDATTFLPFTVGAAFAGAGRSCRWR